MNTRKNVNREVYEGADMIALRLRSAKKPAVIPFLEIPPEEIDLEPVTLEPVDLTDAEPMPIVPLVVPVNEILPFEDDEDDGSSAAFPAVQAEPHTPGPATPSPSDSRTAAPGPVTPGGNSNDGLSLFGVGTILDSKPRGKPPAR